MSEYNNLIALLYELYQVQILKLNTTTSILDFCKQYQLHSCQNYFDYSTLSFVLKEIQPEYIYHYIDPFHVHFYLFTIKDIPFILGPFTPLIMNENDAEKVLEQNSIHNLSSTALHAYYEKLPFVEESTSKKILQSFIHVSHPSEQTKEFKTYDARLIKELPYHANKPKIPVTPQMISDHFYQEQCFIENIKNGNSRAAILNLHNLEENVAPYKKIGTTLERERIGASINRTTVRMSAMSTGLAPIVINQLSTASTIEIESAKTVAEIYECKEKLIKAFCNAIQAEKSNNYSILIQSCIYYLEHHYSNNIDLDELAADLNVSKCYLITSFKKEVGITPIVYLTKIRMKRAALLLTKSKISISEISETVGIYDSNYFVKLFKKEYGMTPSYYRSHPIHDTQLSNYTKTN